MITEEKSKVYVVTRNSRRIEDKNYESAEDAEVRAKQLVETLKKWKDPDQRKVKVVHTDKPNKIR